MKFKALKAYRGDAFVITHQNYALLIDGGMPSTSGDIKREVEGLEISAVIVTHVDNDHIGGIAQFLKSTKHSLANTDFYMNHPDLASRYSGTKVAYHHGDSFKKIIEKHSRSMNPLAQGQRFKIRDIEIEVLSPMEEDIDELHKNWNASKIIEDDKLTYSKRQKNNGDIINRSSISVICSHEEFKLLLLGDSHPDVIENYLINGGYSKDNRLDIDLVKVSHHGSKHNTTESLLKILNCSSFYISTNGGVYNHPDDETLDMLDRRAQELGLNFDIYFNYDIIRKLEKRSSKKFSNLNFILKQEISKTCLK
ncbi:ComEC/Rec2 family competence protein [Vibrio parahaemolyticus]|uniref:ComEC/Rec2 family competence protein n=3 Tax=Vibrio parahaemolyticus TaxID=670 RepID=UPI00111FE55B|nr:MBL fold metallo-hydrolase [Vibrio parahaemolyticus]MBE3782241.1 MBL fold metallo-hydrolase [Vibrio parahaemolyticus]TOB48773.1 MBL fold metallo-hydrolase [Vibrio parahaemolyticus]TOD64830.1 MBL fold metallo-hydrolase [Vibrio parahaemolyticus]TOM67241.1 MBL fold metallo-hydrolase [Vibrio parahaemolyticus]TOO79316.1 MBL fold metallo-hydrolase [Vibrio parahaemolyticus]